MIYGMLVAVLLVGVGIGWFIFGAKRSNGFLYIIKNKNIDEPDIYRFEIDELEKLSEHKKIIVKVKTIDMS